MCFFKSRALLRMNFFNKKRIIVFLSTCLLVLILLLQINSNWRLLDTMRGPPDSEPLVYQCCISMNNSIRTNIFFLKTHKTGGTTVQNVIVRFAIKNSLDMMNTKYDTYYLPISDSSIYPELMTPNNKYNVFAKHARYDSNLKSYQYPDTSMVTILRHPVTLFQSLYIFFRMDKTTGMNFQQFLKAPVKPAFLTGFDSEIAYRGYNQMSVDLGFDLAQSKNTTAVTEFIEKIDREFDFVMITEHMDESFVLLANLMGWPLEYVTSLRLNSRLEESEPYSLTSQDESTIIDLNQVDAQLYDYFLKKFHKCRQQYGENNLNQQVQQLQIMNRNFKERCVAREVTRWNKGFVKRIEYVPRNLFDMECFYSMQESPDLAKITRQVQANRLKALRNE
ncbi:galactose-3-O-sulfotransferase 3-like [Planococcus citri]|uniref:galactose-3-O-sulfotransferase 3-like n=1 Tax=Planococcus citri TaxID=170843 RepID=UPI0031F9E3AB